MIASNMTFPFTVRKAVNMAALLNPSSLNSFMSCVIRFWRTVVAEGPLIDITDLSFSFVNICPCSRMFSFEYNYRFNAVLYCFEIYWDRGKQFNICLLVKYLKGLMLWVINVFNLD